MNQSSLPDEVNSSRPKGMLDRDLRTTLTVRVGGNRRNNQLSSSDHHENCPNKCTSIDRSTTTTTATTMGYTYKCIQSKDADCLWKDRRVLDRKMRLDRKCQTSRGFYRSLKRTKFGHCLLAFLCIWLATIHRTCAYPVMSDQMDLNERCRAIKDALIKPLEQTKVSASYIRNMLDNYTQSQFKKPPSALHAVWRHSESHFGYDSKFVPNERAILTDEFEGEPDAEQVKHIRHEGVPTEDELRTEFQRIYVFLHTIKEVLHRILEDRRNNATQILHDLNNDQLTHDFINKLFEEQSKYNNYEIKEVSTAMAALKIQHPEMDAVTIRHMNIEPSVQEWLTTREHLKVLRYMQGVYNTFNSRCQQ